MTARRVLVTGSRHWPDARAVWAALALELEEAGELVVIHGAAAGADRAAGHWARAHAQAEEAYPARWAEEGKAAGAIRNRRMLAEGRPEVVLAFPTSSSRGTWDCVRAAKAAGVPVKVHRLYERSPR